MKHLLLILILLTYNELDLCGQFEVDPVVHNTALGNSTTSSFWATAMGNSTATGFYSTAMGNSTATGSYSVAMGNSRASGMSSVAMGQNTTANGVYSVALGSNVRTSTSGSFFFGDNDTKVRDAITPNQFVCRFKGGYYFISGFTDPSNSSGDLGMILPANGNSWYSLSDQNRKENIRLLNDEEVLEKLVSVSFSSWNYKGVDPRQDRHYGIMAQEFYRLFGHDGFGNIGNDTLVNPIDMMGIAMSAIKGLNTKMTYDRKLIDQLENQIIRNEKLIESSTHILQKYHDKLYDQQVRIDALTQEILELKTAFVGER